MEKVKEFILNKKYYVIGVVILLICGFIFFFSFNKNNEVNAYILEDETSNDLKEEQDNKEKICLVKVDIKGYVNNPGMYEVDCESRVNNVIELAGGLKDGASTDSINLSKKVEDQMVIIVYSNEELKKNTECVSVKPEEPKAEIVNNADISSCVNACLNKNSTKDNKISLNNASLEELMTLTGVGESKAIAIIKYREENNGFKKIEDIMNVSGIGEKAFEKIKDSIKL